MNKELAIKGLKENLCSLCAYGSQNMDSCDIRECDNRDYIKALEQQHSDDCVSREQALLQLTGVNLSDKTTEELIQLFSGRIKSLPPVTPTHGTCKDCEQSECLGEECYCNNVDEYFDKDFYCADFEKRGSENGI